MTTLRDIHPCTRQCVSDQPNVLESSVCVLCWSQVHRAASGSCTTCRKAYLSTDDKAAHTRLLSAHTFHCYCRDYPPTLIDCQMTITDANYCRPSVAKRCAGWL